MKYIFLLIIIATCIGVFVSVIKPRYDGLESMREEVKTQTANLATAEKLKQSRQELIDRYNEIPKEDLTDLKTLLPDSVDNIRLIIQMDSLATKNGLSKLRSVDYQVQDPTAPTSTVGAEAAAPETVKEQYGEFVMSFQTVGQYKNFLAFLSDIEYNLRLVDVTDVAFDKITTATGSASDSMSYKVTIKTYWLKQ